MAAADLVITGTVLTVDDTRPTAEALAVADGRIVAVGDRSEVADFVDQIHYWGDVIVDGLFGPERGSRWMPAGSAVATGMRISLHNDPPVTPEESLRNISVAVTRKAPSGRVLGPEERLTVEQAIRAQTIDAAWQLFSDDIIGSLEVGKYADLVVLSTDPRSVPPEEIADLEVRATFLAGRQVYAS
jgi:predicted amidohydrolase YtcJ